MDEKFKGSRINASAGKNFLKNQKDLREVFIAIEKLNKRLEEDKTLSKEDRAQIEKEKNAKFKEREKLADEQDAIIRGEK